MDAAEFAGWIFELCQLNGVAVGTRQERRADPSREKKRSQPQIRSQSAFWLHKKWIKPSE
jgi:hypothetical protein